MGNNPSQLESVKNVMSNDPIVESEFSGHIVKVEGGFIDLDFSWPTKCLGLVLKIEHI